MEVVEADLLATTPFKLVAQNLKLRFPDTYTRQARLS